MMIRLTLFYFSSTSKAHSELTYEYLKKGNPRTLINGTGDLCRFLNGSTTEVLIKYVIDMVGTYLPPGYLHACPYVGLIKSYGLNVIGETTHFWPDGVYTFNMRFFNRKDSNIFSLKVEAELTGTGNADDKF